jgi:dTDP-4-amino-4,6-dideoxygalactose transaminase
LLKNTPLLTSPVVNAAKKLTDLPSPHSKLALEAFKSLPHQLEHRRSLAKLYHFHLPKKIILRSLDIENSTCLRYPIVVPDRKKLLIHLKKRQVRIQDIWYKKPVDTGSTFHISSYQPGSCPNSEFLSDHVLNLPTHINCSHPAARRIIKTIKDNF